MRLRSGSCSRKTPCYRHFYGLARIESSLSCLGIVEEICNLVVKNVLGHEAHLYTLSANSKMLIRKQTLRFTTRFILNVGKT